MERVIFLLQLSAVEILVLLLVEFTWGMSSPSIRPFVITVTPVTSWTPQGRIHFTAPRMAHGIRQNQAAKVKTLANAIIRDIILLRSLKHSKCKQNQEFKDDGG